MGIFTHQERLITYRKCWSDKPLLRIAYHDFYQLISVNLSELPDPKVVELGSGLGNITEVIPHCLRTDLFAVPWVDQIENGYSLSFADNSLSDVILFDVFHHLDYPGMVLRECYRALRPGGRLIIFDPCVSALGLIVYGLLHEEGLGLGQPIEWFAPSQWSPNDLRFYAAQGNAFRVFFGNAHQDHLTDWKYVLKQRLSALVYIGSGGYTRPQLFPDWSFPIIKFMEKILDLMPALFATRLLVILEKK